VGTAQAGRPVCRQARQDKAPVLKKKQLQRNLSRKDVVPIRGALGYVP
jgi:hypothetical protein